MDFLCAWNIAEITEDSLPIKLLCVLRAESDVNENISRSINQSAIPNDKYLTVYLNDYKKK